MTHRYLPAAVLAAIAALAAPDTRAQAASGLDGHALSPALTPHARPADAPAWVRDALADRLHWVDDAGLRDPAIRRDAMDALERGLPVLVTGSTAASTGSFDAFGFHPGTSRAVYRRTEGGKLEVGSVDDRMTAPAAARFLVEWLRPPQVRMQRMARALAADAGGTSAYAPSLRIRQDKAFEGGRRIAYDITVQRDITPSRDEKVVLVKTEIFQRPEYNGPLPYGTPQPNGTALMLALPLSYRVLSTVAPVGNEPLPEPIMLERAVPVGGKPKERRIDEKVTAKHTLGLSLETDLSEFIKGMDTDPLGKLPVKFNAGVERNEERSVSMVVDDYEVGVRTREADNGMRGVQWNFDLARDLADERTRFQSGTSKTGYPLYSDASFTPMMRAATMETLSVWRLPGAWEGGLDVTTRADVVNRVFGSRPSQPDHVIDDLDDDLSDIAFTARIDLGSPRLTRQPTVRLQSLSGTGKCLTQTHAAYPDIVMASCEKGDGGREQQWYLDVDHTYRNRASGQCLTVDGTDGTIRAADCMGASLDQQWQWSADRIHSRFMGSDSWRLHLRAGVPNGMFDPQRHQRMMSNHYHDLLRPWSSYPGKPTPGDVIPNPRGASPRVPESFLDYDAVGVEERWQVLPVIKGL